MDSMVLLVGVPRRFEEDDCACIHSQAGTPKQFHVEGLRLHAGGEALKTVPINLRFQAILVQTDKMMGGEI